MKEDSPSATARIVALNLAFVATRPGFDRLVDPEARALNAELLSYSRRARIWLALGRQAWFPRLFDAYESLVVPGMALHQALRKLWLERMVSRCLDEGVRQVVVLGGGLDTLAARLARRHPDVRFLETDHPATQAVKRAALERSGYLGPNLSLAAVDFNRVSPAAALRARPEFRSDVPVLFLCEGVLMYLQPAAVDGLLAGLADLPNPDVRFAFSYMEPGPDGRIAFADSSPLVDAWLKWRKESFTWGLARRDLEGYLAARGFSLQGSADETDLRGLLPAHCSEARIAAGEKLALTARRPASDAG